MRTGKKVLSVLMSLVLVVGLMPLPAFAEASLVAAGGDFLLSATSAKAGYNNDPASILDGKDTTNAYAVLYDDGEMLIQRGNANRKSGLKVTAVYTGFETDDSSEPIGYLEDGVVHTLWNSSVGQDKRHLIMSIKAVDRVIFGQDLSFEGCRNLITADLSKVDVSKVSSFHGYFAGCSSLENLNLTGWDTSGACAMSCMFYDCVLLSKLDLSSFDTSSVIDMSSMFYDCENLESINMSNCKTSKLENAESMFYGCHSLACISVGAGYAGNFMLPQQDSSYILGADGRWYNGSNQSYSCNDIPAYMAATYYARPSDWAKDKSAELTGEDGVRGYKVVYDDGTLVVQVGNRCDDAKLAQGRAVFDYMPFDVNDGELDLGCGYEHAIRRIEIRDKFKAPTSMQSWLSGWKKLSYVDFSNLDTSKTTDMSWLFFDSKNLRSLGVESFDCSSVTTMQGMFCNSPAASSLDFAQFNTGKVKDMSFMFAGSKVSKLNLAGIDTSHVVNMSSMFGTPMLRELDLSGLKTPSLTAMREMFSCCESLKEIDLSSFDVSNVESCSGLFNRCFSLERVNLSGWNTSHMTDMSWMFYDCASLRAIDLTHFNTSAVTSMGNMFEGCKRLVALDLKSFDTSRVTDMALMFYDCASLVNLDLSGFNGNELEYFRSAFGYCRALRSIDLSGLRTPKLKDVHSLFGGCESLVSVNGFSLTLTDDSSDISALFSGCSSLKTVDLSGFNTSRAKNMSCLFEGCSSLESFDASRLDTGNVTDMSRLFSGCSSLESFDASRLDTGNVTDMSGLFSGCSSLRSVNLSKLNTSRVKTMAAMFSGCSSLKKLDLSRFDTSRVKNIAGIFYGCTSLESVDLAGFDTSDLSQYVYTEEERAELSASSMGAQSVASDSQKPIGAASLSAQSALSAQTSTTYTDIFKGCKKLKKVTVGKGFAFKHATLRLPAQSASSVAGANGKWYTVAGKGYTPAKVPSKKAATYYAVAPITAATIIGVKNLAYTGGKLTQNPVVKVSGKKLKRGKDYKVSYANNRKVGTATMTIIGIGNRIGSKKVKFKITKGKLKGVKVVLSKASVKYNKKVQKPAVKTVGGKKLKAGRDYTLKFSKAKPKAPGAYKIWVVGKGNYAARRLRPRIRSQRPPTPWMLLQRRPW